MTAPQPSRLDSVASDQSKRSDPCSAGPCEAAAPAAQAASAVGAAGPDVPAPALLLPAHLLANARVLPDRYAMLPLLPKGRVVVEVGVATGDFSAELLRVCEPSRFVAIDDFRFHTWDMRWAGRPVAEIFGGRTHLEYYRDRFAAEIAGDRMLVMQDDSAAALENLGDGTVDVVYLDADHAYESVRRELAIVARKIRPDGVIVLNDYTMLDVVGPGRLPYGVVQATHEFMVDQGWEMRFLALQSYLYCDVALQRPAPPRPSGVARVACALRRRLSR